MNSRLRFAVVVSASMICANAQCAIISQSASFNLASPWTSNGGVAVGTLTLDSFDPAQGTLDSVDVSIDGSISTNAFLPPFFGVGAPGELIPIPYPYTFSQRLPGLGFAVDPKITFNGVAIGLAPIPFSADISHEFSFSLTESTDLTGLSPVSSNYSGSHSLGSAVFVNPESNSRHRVEYVSSIIGSSTPLVLQPMLMLDPVSAVGPFSGNVTWEGTIGIDYNYTESLAPAVPIPGAAWLFVSALGVVGWIGHRQVG